MTNRKRAKLVKAHDTALARGKDFYQKAEVLFAQLMQGTAVGEPITMPDGKQVAIADQFAESNRAFKAAMICRFVLKQVKSDKPMKQVVTRPQRPASMPLGGDLAEAVTNAFSRIKERAAKAKARPAAGDDDQIPM